MWDFQRQICCKISRFCEILGANFSKKRPVTTAKFVGIFWANSLEINLVCPDLMNIFKFFLIEIIISSFNNNALDKCANGKAFNIMASSVQPRNKLVKVGHMSHMAF